MKHTKGIQITMNTISIELSEGSSNTNRNKGFGANALLILFILLACISSTALAGIDYVYDDTGRLTSATWDDGTVMTYVYDNAGNFMTKTVTLSTGTPTPTATPACLHHGDVNGSGSLTAADAQMAFNFILGLVTLTWEEECAADCNGSGSVTSADAQAIFLSILGMGEGCVDTIGS